MMTRLINKIWRERGSVLIALVVTMVILAALGAAMVSLTGSSTFSLVGANSAARAYFLAESGYRYAESEYLNASGQTARDSVLEAMHKQTYTLNNNEGWFQLEIYPHYFKVDSTILAGTTSNLSTRVPGGFPPGVTLSTGRLKIGAKASNIYDYTSATQAGSNVTFNMSQTLPYFTKNTDVLPVAVSGNSTQAVTKGGNILLQAGSGNAFPLRNGTFAVNGQIYSYKENDLTSNLLTGIEDPRDPAMPGFTVDPNTDIVLQKFVKLESTGEFGSGSVEGLASRKVIYHIPLPAAGEQRQEFVDSFEDKSNWQPSTLGTHEIQGGALRVTGTQEFYGAPKASLIGLDWSATNLDLSVAHVSGNPYFLSYDAQVKVGFDDSTVPDYGFDPVPIPVYYAAGLSFRLDNNNNSYGLSFLRGNNNSSFSPYPDNMDDGIVPASQVQKSLIVLWQLTDSGATGKWLAYKKDLALFLKDDMESGTNGWTTYSPTGLWHQSTRRANSGTTAWYYGQEATGNYDTGAQNNGALESPSIDLSLATSATLTYWTWIKTEPGGGDTWDRKYLLISVNGGPWTDLPGSTIPDDSRTWHQRSYDLSAYCGQTIKVRFRFDTIDDVANAFEGWYIDDVRISGDTAAAVQEATLAVRVKEAASVTFTNGGPNAIENADTVVGQTSGAQGILAGAPILSSGSWAADTAAGTLMLKNTTGAFNVGEQIKALGSAAVAQVSAFSARENFIRAYYGNTSGYGTADGDPLNDEKGAIARGEVRWPPDELTDWDASNDYFELIQWDAVNAGVTLLGSVDEPNAVIRDATLTSPSASPLAQPELGLHAFGKGATNVYFDDFALQTDLAVGGDVGFVGSIQE